MCLGFISLIRRGSVDVKVVSEILRKEIEKVFSSQK
jgi:hypothetical protein